MTASEGTVRALLPSVLVVLLAAFVLTAPAATSAAPPGFFESTAGYLLVMGIMAVAGTIVLGVLIMMGRPRAPQKP